MTACQLHYSRSYIERFEVASLCLRLARDGRWQWRHVSLAEKSALTLEEEGRWRGHEIGDSS
ncbi:hypothetical protein SADUNF_Sadunf13G0018000 [Salix dunnii]|uniref:Uncharacterized protein n=1 Tax=Salix dunnii TaxID=1413687 RepID=A0A835MQR3_9ROSI|nr:hypothetical protein SADUNF_Sadunf13G0018000 [Salix dunnii]